MSTTPMMMMSAMVEKAASVCRSQWLAMVKEPSVQHQQSQDRPRSQQPTIQDWSVQGSLGRHWCGYNRGSESCPDSDRAGTG